MCDFHWLPIKLRIQFKFLLFVSKVIHSIAPSYIKELIFITTQRPYSLRLLFSAILFTPPLHKTKTTLGDRNKAAPIL